MYSLLCTLGKSDGIQPGNKAFAFFTPVCVCVCLGGCVCVYFALFSPSLCVCVRALGGTCVCISHFSYRVRVCVCVN